MRRLDALLAPDEAVVLRTRLHPAALAGTVGFSLFVLGVVALIVARNELAPATVTMLWVAGVAVIAVGWVMPLRRWLATALVLTPRRLLVRTAGWRVHVFDVPEPDATVVQVDDAALGRLLGYGTLRAATADGDLVIARLAGAAALRDAISARAGRPARARRR